MIPGVGSRFQQIAQPVLFLDNDCIFNIKKQLKCKAGQTCGLNCRRFPLIE